MVRGYRRNHSIQNTDADMSRKRTKDEVQLIRRVTNKGNSWYSVRRKVSLFGIFHKFWWWSTAPFYHEDGVEYEVENLKWAKQVYYAQIWDPPEVAISSQVIDIEKLRDE